jgi:hypothetical protein
MLTYGDAQCNYPYGPFTIANDGDCVSLGGTYTLVAYHKWPKLPLTPGTCTTGPAAPAPMKSSGKQARSCAAPPAGAEDVCTGNVQMGFHPCIQHAGDVACPAGPFSHKLVAGGDVDVQCGACSPCSVSATCGNATLEYHGNYTCTQLKGSIAADGNCNQTNMASGVNHFKYIGQTQNVVCAGGTSTPAADLANKRTICCR